MEKKTSRAIWFGDAAVIAFLRYLGLDPDAIWSVTIHVRVNKPVVVEYEGFARQSEDRGDEKGGAR